ISIIKYRLLDIEVFGIVAIATSVFTILRMVQTLGFSGALVQKGEISDDLVDSVLWLVVAVSLGLSVGVAGLSGYLARLYETPVLNGILLVFAALFVINALPLIQQSVLSRDLQFKVIGLINVAGAISSGLITVVLAYLGYGVWSLVMGAVASSLVSLVLYTLYCPWKPRLVFRRHMIRETAKFSLNVTLCKTLSILRQQAPQLLIGKLLGTEVLGLFTFARNLILLFVNQIDAMMASVLFPVFARLQGDNRAIERAYHKINHYTFIAVVPFVVGFTLLGTDLVAIVYGSKWLSAIGIAQLLLLATMLNSVYSKGSSVIAGKGRPELLVKIEAAALPATLLGLFVVAPMGLMPIVLVIVTTTALAFAAQLLILKKLIGWSWRRAARSISNPLLASLGMTIIVLAAQALLGAPAGEVPLFVTFVLLGAFAYAVTLFILEKDELKQTALLLMRKSE
ncbi:lipopolysaccharide biosynthesis protein, partial [Rhodothermus sp. AH-315-K08]|nr:lipopolysaccharide biosynthesis protein [Rhodothermus sp. AH-315-K08]